MKVHILFEIKDTSSGGGNQFLKALKNYFISCGVYSESLEDADIFLYNSYQFIPKLLEVKKKFPSKLFVHRIDGPIRLYNELSDHRDHVVNIVNRYVADGTIFQSLWSRERNLEMGLCKNRFEATIMNAPDPDIFYRTDHFGLPKKIRLIATSWSSNRKKGFDLYQWLDKNLDFQRYEFTFIGNSPVQFKNIVWKKPMNSQEIAQELRAHHIFITASQNDSCSNSLIEALHCGLPALVINSGGNPEIIGSAGRVFERQEQIPDLLEEIVHQYEIYRQRFLLPDMKTVGAQYVQFLKSIYEDKSYIPKDFGYFSQFQVNMTLAVWRLKMGLANLKSRVLK